jgi:hypothetical protein
VEANDREFEKIIEKVLSTLEVSSAELITFEWSEIEKMTKNKRIKTADREALHRFYQDAQQSSETVQLI